MRRELTALNTALPDLDWLEISDRTAGAIKLTPLDPVPEPRNLRKLKRACVARWGTVQLIEMLKEAALRTGALRALTGVGTRGSLPEDVLIERLLLIAYAYGTNSGLRTVAAGEHAHSEEDLRYTARRYFTAAGLKAAGVEIANATFAARQAWIWGESTTTVPRTPATSARLTATSSPSGTPATAAAACSSTGTSRKARWRSTPKS